MTVEPISESLVATPESEATLGTSLARATTILAIGNIVSRVLGFAKEILLANYFGAGSQIDAFQIAITVPQDLYDLAISGHVNSALVPVLSEYAVKDRRELWRLMSLLLGLVTLLTTAIVLVMEIFAPQIIGIYDGGASSKLSVEAFDLSVNLLRLTAPALIFLNLFSVFAGLLYALKRFTWPALGGAVFNGTIVVAVILLAPVIGIERAAIGWVLGAIAQLVLQFRGLRDIPVGLRLRGIWHHPGIRRIGLFYLPVLLSLIVDVLINRPFSYALASQAGEGNIGYMNWATSLREFPMGLVGTAISIAILPTLVRQALSTEAIQQFKDTLGRGMRLALTLIIPATVGMFVLAGPLIGLIFEHGAFTADNTTTMSIVLRLYLLGIPFAAIDLLLVFAFYAHKDSLTPALIGIFSLGCYIVITLLLRPIFGFFSLMIADSAKHLIHAIISLIVLRRRINGLGAQKLLPTLSKVILATTVMALVTYALARSAVTLWPVQNVTQRLLLVFVPSILGGATYFVLASLFKLNEFTLFVQALTRRVRR